MNEHCPTNAPPETTAAETVERFSRSRRAVERLRAWEGDRHKADVIPFVEAHVTATAYRQTPGSIEEVCRRTSHALESVGRPGIGIRRDAANAVHDVVDWHPSFAFTHVLHAALEKSGRVLTFQEFRAFCNDDPDGRRMLGDPARELHERLSAHYGDAETRNAIRWRIGNAYYSFLRELYAIAVLLDNGVEARFHPLADALFRVDCWVGDANINLFVINRAFRGRQLANREWEGRKIPSSELVSDAVPPFRDVSIPLDVRHEYGNVHLPNTDLILEEARGAGLLAHQAGGSR